MWKELVWLMVNTWGNKINNHCCLLCGDVAENSIFVFELYRQPAKPEKLLSFTFHLEECCR